MKTAIIITAFLASAAWGQTTMQPKTELRDSASRVILITEAEADRIKAAENALHAAKYEIAKAHGVANVDNPGRNCWFDDGQDPLTSSTQCYNFNAAAKGLPSKYPDTFRFSGRFLLVGDMAKVKQ